MARLRSAGDESIELASRIGESNWRCSDAAIRLQLLAAASIGSRRGFGRRSNHSSQAYRFESLVVDASCAAACDTQGLAAPRLGDRRSALSVERQCSMLNAQCSGWMVGLGSRAKATSHKQTRAIKVCDPLSCEQDETR